MVSSILAFVFHPEIVNSSSPLQLSIVSGVELAKESLVVGQWLGAQTGRARDTASSHRRPCRHEQIIGTGPAGTCFFCMLAR